MNEMKCPIFKECGACQFLNLSYSEQLKLKEKNVTDAMKGTKITTPVKPVLGMDKPYHYRNKNHAVITLSKKGNVISAFYAEGTHKTVPYTDCLIQDEKADEIIASVTKILTQQHIPPYNEDAKFGLIRHMIVKTGYKTGEIMVVIVTASDVFPGRNNFIKTLRDAHPEITTIIQNTNTRKTSILLGDNERVLFGKGYIEDELLGLKYKISAKSFYQVNPVQTEVLYSEAIKVASLNPNDVVLDAYCGIGTIGLTASKDVKEVIGVELNSDAVKDAIQNAKMNNRKNIRFYHADASEFMNELANEKTKINVVFLDPPRSGCDETFLKALNRLKPERIVYVSCDPYTQARDLTFLTVNYQIKNIQPVDMFPQTSHVENVVLLELKK